MGSSVSLFGGLRLGSSLSMFSAYTFGSSLSLRSFSRLGSYISIVGSATEASIKCGGDLVFTTNANQVFAMNQWGGNSNRMKFQSTTRDYGTLKGTWFADEELDTSDRRLKENIAPLGVTMQKRREHVRGSSGPGRTKQEPSAVSWVLRELRPVSFRFKAGEDEDESKAMPSKQLRFGFIAQEMKRVTPELVESITEPGISTANEPLAVRYKDLLAVLTLAFQEQQQKLIAQDSEIAQAQQEAEDLLEMTDTLERFLDEFENNPTAFQRPISGASFAGV